DGTRPRRDRSAAETQDLAANFDLIARDETGFAMKHINTEACEPRRGIVCRELRPDATHPLHDRGEIDARIVLNRYAEARGVTDRRGDARRAKQGLRGDTSVVEAITAHQMAFDQRDLRA